MSRRDRELKSYALFKCLSLSGVFIRLDYLWGHIISIPLAIIANDD